MDNNTTILTIPDIMQLYGLSREKVTELLNTPGCPILPRRKGQKFLISKDAWERWIARERR